MKLQTAAGNYAVCRLGADADWPEMTGAGFASITRTADELSIVCEVHLVPPSATNVETGWRMLRVIGPIPFETVGVLASLTVPLAESGISVFAISTFDTDYLMVKADKLDATVTALTTAGFEFGPLPDE